MTVWNLDGFTRHLRAAGHSEETIRLRSYHLRRCADEVAAAGPHEVTVQLLELWLSNPSWTASYKRSLRASLRVYYTWAVREGIVTRSPAHDLAPIKVPRARPRPTPHENYSAGFAAGDVRVRRALRLGKECGLRRGEIVKVRPDAVEPDLHGWSLRVVGKGGHVRLVPLPDDLAADLRSIDGEWAFPSPRGGHLTPGHLGRLVTRALDGYSTHTLRHRAGTEAFAATLNIRAVQEFLGHAKVETTMLYTDVSRAAIREAMRAAAAA